MCPKFVVDLSNIIPLYVPAVCVGVIVLDVFIDCVMPVPILNRSAVFPPIDNIDLNWTFPAGALGSETGPKLPDAT